MMQQGSIRGAFVVALALLVALPAPGARGQAADVPLAPGTWLGTMGAGGALTGNVDGVSALWTGWIDGSFTFDVTAGTATGAWDWSGAADIFATTPAGDLTLTMQSLASGPLTGSPARLTLTGQQSTTGQGTFMGITTDVGPVPNPVDPIDVVFVDASCNVAFADWTTSLEEIAAEGGLSGSLIGFFIATNIAPTAATEEAADLAARFEDHHDRALVAVGGLGSGFSTATLLNVLELIEEGVALEAEARLLENSCAFDQVDGGPFATPLTSLLASLLRAIVPTLEPNDLMNAAQVLLAVGAIGPGASPVVADLMEPLLTERTQSLFDESVLTDSGVHNDGRSCTPVEPCIIVDRGIVQLFVTADLLGVKLTAGGAPIEYGQLIAAQR